jgi:transposase
MWQLRVRKFFCDHPVCHRQICTERLPDVVAPGARRPARLAAHLPALAGALGGAAGGWRRQQRALAVSRNTLVRLLRRRPVPACVTPTVLGGDAFALQKRQPYGPVRIERARRQPVALWPEREAAPRAQWLRTPPGGEVSTHDRARAYADGARQGAPEARQGAARFPLLQNLVEALAQGVHTPRAARAAVHAMQRGQGVPRAAGPGAAAGPPPPPTGQEQTAQRRARRVECHQPGWALREHGWPGQAIAAHLGIGKRTVWRSLRPPPGPERPRRSDRGRRRLTPSNP